MNHKVRRSRPCWPTWETPSLLKKKNTRPGTGAHTYNPSTLGGRGEWITRSRDQDHPGQHGETPSLRKIQKLAGHGGACLQSQLLRRLRQENCLNSGGRGCGKPRSHHCTPAWVTEQDSIYLKRDRERVSEGCCTSCDNPHWL